MSQQSIRLSLFTLLFLAVSISTLAVPVPQDNPEKTTPVAQGRAQGSHITWQPRARAASILLTVTTPTGQVIREEFGSGVEPVFNLINNSGQTWPDGQYIYELRAMPLLDASVRESLAAAREQGNEERIANELRKRGLLPSVEAVQSGAFRILGGAIVMGDAIEAPIPGRGGSANPPLGAVNRGKNGTQATLDVVVADDQIVQGSICVGLDCVNNENFGADTIRLKENNLRINFDDTSNSAGFAANDWRLVANDQANGGANRFSIEDATAATVPFTVAAGAPSNSLYVASSGNVGLGTATPVLDVHAVNGNTPAIRLEQDGSSGFSPQTWDVAGNETNFFVRDVTNGSLLPFKIRPGAASNTLYISAESRIGLGTASPEQKLHVVGNAVIEGSLEVRDGSFFTGNNAKALAAFNTGSVLERLSKVSVATWKDGETNRIAPNLKELGAAFGLQSTSLLDLEGINLAAIKALQERLEQRETELRELQTRNAALQRQLADFETRMKAIEARLSPRR